MTPRQETIAYFESLTHRIIDYVTVKDQAVRFIKKQNRISESKASSAVVLALLWLAQHKNELLTEQDIIMFCGGDLSKGNLSIVSCFADLNKLSLKEVLTIAISNE